MSQLLLVDLPFCWCHGQGRGQLSVGMLQSLRAKLSVIICSHTIMWKTWIIHCSWCLILEASGRPTYQLRPLQLCWVSAPGRTKLRCLIIMDSCFAFIAYLSCISTQHMEVHYHFWELNLNSFAVGHKSGLWQLDWTASKPHRDPTILWDTTRLRGGWWLVRPS